MIQRSELSKDERRGLDVMVARLFEGVTLSFRDQRAGSKFLCFRMAGEELPDVPRSEQAFEASESGLFITGETYKAGEVRTRTWLGIGPLEEILVRLEDLGDPRKLLRGFLFAHSASAAIGRERCQPPGVALVVAEIDHPSPPDSARNVADKELADKELEGYDFGEGVEVLGHEGWVYDVHRGNRLEMSKTVYLKFAEDSKGADSRKATFSVFFEGGSVADVVAVERGEGVIIGSRAAPQSRERTRG